MTLSWETFLKKCRFFFLQPSWRLFLLHWSPGNGIPGGTCLKLCQPNAMLLGRTIQLTHCWNSQNSICSTGSRSLSDKMFAADILSDSSRLAKREVDFRLPSVQNLPAQALPSLLHLVNQITAELPLYCMMPPHITTIGLWFLVWPIISPASCQTNCQLPPPTHPRPSKCLCLEGRSQQRPWGDLAWAPMDQFHYASWTLGKDNQSSHFSWVGSTKLATLVLDSLFWCTTLCVDWLTVNLPRVWVDKANAQTLPCNLALCLVEIFDQAMRFRASLTTCCRWASQDLTF